MIARIILVCFGTTILLLAVGISAASPKTPFSKALTAVALPWVVFILVKGAWTGAFIYRRLADRGYQRVVMLLLLLSGATLIWTLL